jgi:hypothetical protein
MDGAMTEAYGQRLGEALRVENTPAIVTRALRKADIAVTEVRCDDPLPEMSSSIQQENAFLVALQLRDFPEWEYWEDGRRTSVCDLRVGETCLHDLERDPAVLLDKPYYALFFIYRVRRWTRSLTRPMRGGARIRTVLSTTVSFKMSIGIRGINAVEL